MSQSRDNLTSHIPFLDPLRGFAILIVVLFHSFGMTFGLFRFDWNGIFPDFNVRLAAIPLLPLIYGNMGVPLFFVISGFCIHLSHLRSRESNFRSFFVRRFFRIYPPYFVALLLFSFVYPWQVISLDNLFNSKLFITHLLLIHNLNEATLKSINPSFWSLAIEFQLYLIYPLLFAISLKWGWHRALIVIAIIEITFRLAAYLCNFTSQGSLAFSLYFLPFAYWFSWAVGAALADAYAHDRELPFVKQPFYLWLLAWFISTLVKPLIGFSFTLFAVSTAIFMAKALSKQSSTRSNQPSFATKYLTHLGVISYSVYLFHQPIIDIIPKLTSRLFQTNVHPYITFGIALLFLHLTAAIWLGDYRYLEVPSINIGKRITHRIRSAKAL